MTRHKLTKQRNKQQQQNESCLLEKRLLLKQAKTKDYNLQDLLNKYAK